MKEILKILQKHIYKDGDIYVFYNRKAIRLTASEIATLYEAKLKEERPENFDSLMTHDKETITRWYLDLLNGKGAKEQLLRYKIWENIFGSDYDTVETLIEGYFEYLKTRTNG